jgi:ATP-dependent helicase/nuclease subunit B
MAQLRLILGPAGSGKTHTVLREVAERAAAAPMGPPANAYLLVIVPEQQAAQIERDILLAIQQLGGPPATARVRVMGFSRLAALLASPAEAATAELGDLGRQLALWQLLRGQPELARRLGLAGDGLGTASTAPVAALIAELSLQGASPDTLRQRSALLDGDDGSLSAGNKLRALGDLLEAYRARCQSCGYRFVAPASHIPERLHRWPMLAQTEVWLDGFATLTPAEENAVEALLHECRNVSVTQLLDAAGGRLEGPAAHDVYDWYTLPREQYQRWPEVAARAVCDFDAVRDTLVLPAPLRWSGGSQLASLALNGPQREAQADAGGTQQIELVNCADAFIEVLEAARIVRRLILPPELGGSGMRCGEISIVTRDRSAYHELLELQLGDHGIPAFFDQRRSLRHHPAVELLRGSLRLVLATADSEDALALLRCGLLDAVATPAEPAPAGDGNGDPVDTSDPAGVQRCIDRLAELARRSTISAERWIGESRWPTDAGMTGGSVVDLDTWRCSMLAPVRALAAQFKALPAGQHTVRALLELAWQALLGEPVYRRLLRLAELEEAVHPPRRDIAAQHRAALAQLALLVDQLVLLGGDCVIGDGEVPGRIDAAEFCSWLDDGIEQLSMALPPPGADCVLVTDIVRGRHHGVRATILLGLADGTWPPAAPEGALVTEAERASINAAGRLLDGGALSRAENEPYLFMVAATRPSELLYVLRPVADRDGRRMAPSPFFTALSGDGVKTRTVDAAGMYDVAAVQSVEHLAIAAGLSHPRIPELAAALGLLLNSGSPVRRGLRWAADHAAEHPRVDPADVQASLGRTAAGLTLGSVRQLETFAQCPQQHYVTSMLRLSDPRPGGFSKAQLSRLYRETLSATVHQLNRGGFDWEQATASAVTAAALASLDEIARQVAVEFGRLSFDFIRERMRLVLPLVAQQVAASGGSVLATGVTFGSPDAPLPPVRLDTAYGPLAVSGRMDRLDIDAAGRATAVDYSLKGELDWTRVAGGSDLGSLAGLLALDGADGSKLGSLLKLSASGLAVQGTELSWSSRDEGSSKSTSVNADKAGADALDNVRQTALAVMSSLAERLLSGDVAALPLKTPAGHVACHFCGYRSICRFDPARGDRYRELPPLTSARLGRLLLEQGPGALAGYFPAPEGSQ